MSKFDLGHGTLGNGVTVWNRAVEVNGDYKTIAHISREREITWYIKRIPDDVRLYVENIAAGPNFAMSTSQPDMKVFDEMNERSITLEDALDKLPANNLDEILEICATAKEIRNDWGFE